MSLSCISEVTLSDLCNCVCLFMEGLCTWMSACVRARVCVHVCAHVLFDVCIVCVRKWQCAKVLMCMEAVDGFCLQVTWANGSLSFERLHYLLLRSRIFHSLLRVSSLSRWLETKARCLLRSKTKLEKESQRLPKQNTISPLPGGTRLRTGRRTNKCCQFIFRSGNLPSSLTTRPCLTWECLVCTQSSSFGTQQCISDTLFG